jgi:hypothetical protein
MHVFKRRSTYKSVSAVAFEQPSSVYQQQLNHHFQSQLQNQLKNNFKDLNERTPTHKHVPAPFPSPPPPPPPPSLAESAHDETSPLTTYGINHVHEMSTGDVELTPLKQRVGEIPKRRLEGLFHC